MLRVLRAMAACPLPRGFSRTPRGGFLWPLPQHKPHRHHPPSPLPCTDFSQHSATCHPGWNHQAGRDPGSCRHTVGSAQSERQLTPLGVSPAPWGPRQLWPHKTAAQKGALGGGDGTQACMTDLTDSLSHDAQNHCSGRKLPQILLCRREC